MSLELTSRICGTVLILECKGRLVAGTAGETLLSILHADAFHDLKQVVLEMSALTRLDSSGLGLLVRYANSLRHRGGDLRLAAPAPHVMEVIHLTRIDSILKIFPTEDEAALSFLQDLSAPACAPGGAGCVLLVDHSPDFCAFAAALLTQNGYQVKAATLVRDARILLLVEPADFILIGPSTLPEALSQTIATFRSLAPGAKVIALDPALNTEEPDQAAEALLQLLATPTPSHA